MIEQTLKDHRLIPQKKSRSESGVNKVSEEIAHFVVDKLLFEKFANEEEKKKMQEKIEEQEKKRREKQKEQSREMDRQRTEEQERISECFAEMQAQEYAGKKVDDLLQKDEILGKDYNDGVHKCNYYYRLPEITWHPEYEGDTPGLPAGLIDQVVDRMMLRALFDVFYDFNETRFRRDFIERAKLLSPDDTTYFDGFHELTKQLVNPIGTYAFPKNKERKKLRITVSPETEKRIRDYASENHITTEKAIDDWIWSQQLESDKKDK